MWTRSAKDKITGKMTVVRIDWNGNLFFQGEFDNLSDAEKAGQDAERRITFEMQNGPAPSLEEIMSDDELLEMLNA